MEVKACKELIVGLTDVAVAVAQVLKDGKLDITDVGALMGLIAKQGEITAAIKGVALIPAEIKDISAEEIKDLAQALLTAVQTVKAA